MTPTLTQLVNALPEAAVLGGTDLPIAGICSDSRQVSPGCLFVAYQGVAQDGHDYVNQALDRGAAAVVAEKALESLARPVPVVVVPSGRETLAYLMAAWYGFPARRLIVVGVTGTDGKTTTCNLLRSILGAAGQRTGLITTVNAIIGDRAIDTGLHTTTPDSPDVQRFLAGMVDAGLEIAIVETTSHGLAQHRVSACDFDLAVVTNVTHEHLDIHGSLEKYQQAKAMLFTHLGAGYRKAGVPKTAVLNVDDDSYHYLRAIPVERQIGYSIRGDGDVVALGIDRSRAGGRRQAGGLTQLNVRTHDRQFDLRTALPGDYNVSNILAATSAALALGVLPEAIQEGVSRFNGLVGRMERVDEGQDFVAIVDFAHTPNALEQALKTARTLTEGRVIAVFGSAGERDVAKRAWMGEIGARLADLTVLTAEDPRSEPVEMILGEMARGSESGGGVEGETYFRIADRAQAIQFAVDMAGADDLVITLGKGHEQSMCYGQEETPWSEEQALRAALLRRPRRE